MRKLLIAAGLLFAMTGVAAFTQNAAPTLVFFDWGKPELSGDARATLDEAAAAYRQAPGARLTISGHTDRSGSAATNRLAGLKRARAVGAYLATRGVPAAAMAISSHGEGRPIVPTEDGVREVQNRRVEVSVGR